MTASTTRTGSPRTGQTLTARSRRTRVALVAGVRAELQSSGTFTAETVAVRAGCSSATFYSHFGNKNDALAAGFTQTLDDLVDGIAERLTVEALTADLDGTVHAFVEWQADFFRVESLVFRTAISQLPSHRPLRHAYRRAEERTLELLTERFAELAEAGTIPTADPERVAEAFMVASQGVNNPRALRTDADDLRRSLSTGIAAMLVAGGTDHG